MSNMGVPMNGNPLTLSASLPRQSIGNSLGSQMSISGLADVTLGNSMAMNGGSAIYSTGYGMTPASCASPLSVGGSSSPTLPNMQMSCGMQEMGETWRGSSIATLRRKALEHTANMTGFR